MFICINFAIMETNRQKKIAGVLQRDLVDILQSAARENMRGVIISVTKVYVTSDLGQAKIYLSVFPPSKRASILDGIRANTSTIRYEMAQRTKNQLRRMPELSFFIDDSLDYIENIDAALRGEDEDPIKNPAILSNKKKK
jgi:ribosome-binding factor A